MKRSEINRAYRRAKACFAANGWTLPPEPRWDITDMGLGDFERFGLVLINLAEEPEYCEKLMYAERDQATPAHCHKVKKEDIICRQGQLAVIVWPRHPDQAADGERFEARVNGKMRGVLSGETVHLRAGERITLVPGVYHEFYPENGPCIIGEVSTANDDLHDNFFVNPKIGRFPGITEDEEPEIHLISESGE